MHTSGYAHTSWQPYTPGQLGQYIPPSTILTVTPPACPPYLPPGTPPVSPPREGSSDVGDFVREVLGVVLEPWQERVLRWYVGR